MRRPTILEKIPRHLHPFIAEQNPSLYTAMDQASWRYIMRVSKRFFAHHAHQKYLDGLKETGISTESIPLIDEIDRCLEQFGWRAVAVVGFIPPAVFMEFLSLGVLPIACDIRRLEHLAYTPAPDIVHEAAGHAPIIADQQYADYLFQYGEIARKVIFSSQDMDLYEAIRALSDIKEDPHSTPKQIQMAEQHLDKTVASVEYVSEATELARMSWWTIEYGLVGDLKSPKIYGAGLLSSVAESYHCLGSEIRKIPFSLDCIKMSYDITKPQPQLYVTPDFETLGQVLDQLADTMAFRRGGVEGLEKAKRARTVTTAVLDSKIQISGVLVDVKIDSKGQPIYLRYQGPSQLSFSDYEISGQGPQYHREGFSTPIGVLKSTGKSPADLSESELKRFDGKLEFVSGIVVKGKLKSKAREEDRNVILSFEDCTVGLGDEVLFRPEWGTFDMACGDKVISVFGGAADRGKYLEATGGYKQKPASQKSNLTPENRELVPLYAQVRKIREHKNADIAAATKTLSAIHEVLEKKHSDDWLLRLELLEFKGPWEATVRRRLTEISKLSKDNEEMIRRGLEALEAR